MDGEKLGKYEIRGILGKGAMGTVYDALDPVIDRRVAIKTAARPDPSDAQAAEEFARFKREAQAAGRLTHPNIVGIFDYGETDKLAYIVMEFIDGRSLKAVLDAGERLPPAEVVRVMEGLLAGLAYSHERGVVHRDIKPANVMLTQGGAVKIADFGIARIESSSMTQAGTIMGTPAYMSPEQFMGQTVDSRTDIYSAGVVLYQLLTGERPFDGSMTAIMHKVLNTEPPKPSDLSVNVPRAFDGVVSRAMAKRPDARFASAAAFAQELRGAMTRGNDVAEAAEGTVVMSAASGFALGTEPLKPPPGPTPPPAAPAAAAKQGGGGKAMLFGGIAVLVVVVAVGGYFLLRPSLAPKPAPKPAAVTVPAPTQPPPATPAPQPAPSPTPAPPPAKPAPTPAPTPAVQPPAPAPATPQAQPPAAPPAATPPAPSPSPAPAQTAPTPPASPKIDLAAIGTSAAAASATIPCALLHGQVGQDGSLTVQGLAGQAEDGALRKAFAGVGAASTAISVDSFTGPYCPVLNAIGAAAPGFTAPRDLRLDLVGGAGHLVKDAHVIPRLTLPDYPSYLAVYYIASDGSIALLHPSADEKMLDITAPDGAVVHRHVDARSAAEVLPAGAQVTIADPQFCNCGASTVGWTVAPPYGTDMIIAIASSAPLSASLPSTSTALPAFAAGLGSAIKAARDKGVKVAVGATLVHTAAQ